MTLQHLRNRTERRAAFTLMEVLVVVAILVVLAGVGGVIFMRAQQDAYIRTAKVQLKELTTACQMYSIAHDNTNPPTLQELLQPSDGGQAYLQSKALVDPWGQQYQYDPNGTRNGQSGQPDIWSMGPSKGGDPNSIIGNWN